LADDRLLRRATRAQGCSVVGFPGLLLEAVSQDHLQAQEAIDLLDGAIRDYGYRISIRLYQELLHSLENT
jgi:predicted nucleic acid-binding protein